MAEKIINSRIIHKHDIEANWQKAINFIPQQGEIIVYDIDANYNYERFKIGDGITNINILPFANDYVLEQFEEISTDIIDEICSNSDDSIDMDLVDTITGKRYSLVVTNGKLTMVEEVSE